VSSQTRLVRDEHQKEIVRLFESLSGRHNRWTIWCDWVVMSAIAISNVVDKVHAEKREKTYMTLAGKYTKKELECFASMLALLVEAMEYDADRDFLGEMYMVLELSNKNNGQFFTPYDICKCMARMTAGNLRAEIEKKGWVSVNDPACGAGALLVAFANECSRQKINYQTSVLFVAQDVDMIVGCMCYLQMTLLGCAGYVVVDNTLTNPSTSYEKRGLLPVDRETIWYTPLYFMDVWNLRRAWAQMDVLISAGNDAVPVDVEEKEDAPLELPERPRLPQQEEDPEPEVTYGETKFGQLTLF